MASPAVALRQEYDDWAILFDADTGDAFGVNPTGVLVWQLLDGHHGPGEIAAVLRQQCSGGSDDAEEHVARFIRSLLLRGLAGMPLPAA